MATAGKVPTLGFSAGALRFVVLLGFGQGVSNVALAARWTPTLSLDASFEDVPLAAGWSPTISLAGRWE